MFSGSPANSLVFQLLDFQTCAILRTETSGATTTRIIRKLPRPLPTAPSCNPFEIIGAPDRIRTCDLCLRRAKDKGSRAFQSFPAYSKNPLNKHFLCIGIPRDTLQFSSRCLLCAYFLKASKHRFEVSHAKCQAHQDCRGQRQSRSRR